MLLTRWYKKSSTRASSLPTSSLFHFQAFLVFQLSLWVRNMCAATFINNIFCVFRVLCVLLLRRNRPRSRTTSFLSIDAIRLLLPYHRSLLTASEKLVPLSLPRKVLSSMKRDHRTLLLMKAQCFIWSKRIWTWSDARFIQGLKEGA